MSKYYLSYLEKGKIKKIELDKLECLSDRNVTDIDTIDDFTTSFDGKSEMLTFLKRNRIIADNINHLFISSDYMCEKDVVKKIVAGEKILYKSDRKLLNLSFTKRWFTIALKNNPNFIIRVCDIINTKYNPDKIKIFNRLKNFIIDLYRDNKIGDILNEYESEKFDDLLKEFYNFEFKKGQAKKWKHIHDFAVILKNLDESLEYYCVIPDDYGKKKGYLVFEDEIKNSLSVKDNYKKEKSIIEQIELNDETVTTKDDNKYYEEEFLTREDFERQDEKNILTDYEKPNYEEKKDGQNYIKPKSKEEIRRDLSSLATQVMEIQKQNRTR